MILDFISLVGEILGVFILLGLICLMPFLLVFVLAVFLLAGILGMALPEALILALIFATIVFIARKSKRK